MDEVKTGISRRDFMKGVVAAGGVAAAASTFVGCSSPNTSTEADTSVTDASGSEGLSLDQALGKWSFEIAPEPIADSEIAETIEDDIVIIGSGMSGLTTAYSAAESGASVTLFSASSAPVSRGGSNYAAYSKVLEERNIEKFDVVSFYWHEMKAASYQIDQSKWIKGYNRSEEAMNWMIDLAAQDGLKVILERDNTFDGGPYYAHAFSTEGDQSMVSTGQQGAVETMERHAKDAGVTIIYDVVAKQLIREDDNTGRVSGVVAQRDDGSYVKFSAGQAVVLATGDFSANKEMLAKYCPMVLGLAGTEQGEVDYNTGFSLDGVYGGDGQKMGLWVGAAWQYAYPNAPIMQGAWGGSHEPCGFHFGLNINTRTERYSREDISAPYSSNHLLTQPGNIAYGIWTKNYAQDLIDRGYSWYLFGSDFDLPAKTADEMIEIWESGLESGSYYKADTLSDLAAQLNLDGDKLEAVVGRYNGWCESGVDEDFQKHPDFLVEIEEEGPFYAAMNYAIFMGTTGGLRTNVDMQVCDEGDNPIPGLFNVGVMVGDMYANTYNFAIPGNCYGINCLTFGYLLGRDLADGKFNAQ